ncbi:PREDICTED: uncharacterized protein LOC109467921 isoform X2 [Branchiostoma belcheri]|uniref:Uncharacterized protein LOC109467921 isoform X2 n=1 Tax=Branchiostoma belcheri TaxID=7741 RepID=A0A6P4YB12_BRABE|nr:PREDICTED: uncharacterized protein LOC109467921 isoform X2 [Branchiostoma belcheri]
MTSPSIAKMSAMAFKDMSRLERERMMVPHAGQCQRTPTFPSDIHMHGATFQGNIRGATFLGDSYITGPTSFKPERLPHPQREPSRVIPQTRGYAPSQDIPTTMGQPSTVIPRHIAQPFRLVPRPATLQPSRVNSRHAVQPSRVIHRPSAQHRSPVATATSRPTQS